MWEARLQDPDWPFLARILADGVALVHPGQVPEPWSLSKDSSFNAAAVACQQVIDSELAHGLCVVAPEW